MRLLTIDQVRERTQLGKTKLYELMARGELEYVRVGRARRVVAEQLDMFIARLVDEHGGQM